MKKLSFTGVVLATLTVLIWGSQLPIAKSTFDAVDPLHATALRYGVSALILLPILAWREGAQSLSFAGRGPLAWTIGFLGMSCSPALVFGGLVFTRPEVAAVIIALQPGITALVQRVLLGRPVSRFTLGCIALAFLGVVTVVTRWSIELAPQGLELLGDLMVFAGALCWIVYNMGAERFAGWSNLRLTTLTVVPGAVGAFGLALLGQTLGWVSLPPAQAWVSVGWELAFLTLLGVLISMLLWNGATRRLGALNAVLFLNMMPVVTFALRFAQGHRFLVIELVGAAMVIAALVANNLHLRRTLAAAELR